MASAIVTVSDPRIDMKSNPISGTATDDEYFCHFLNRTIMLLGEDAVQTLRQKTVAIAGCGGQGGAAGLTLARMGVGGFVLADPKPFDEPDINRQWGANRSTLGRNKAEVYAEMLRDINPQIRLRVFDMGITETNVEDFLTGADVLVDCLDISVSGDLRKRVFATASSKGMHIFTGAMVGFGGMVAGSYPGGLSLEVMAGVEDGAIGGSSLPRGLKDIFVPDHLDRLEKSLPIRRAPSIAVSPGLLAMLLSVETALALLGNTIAGWRPPVCLPRLLFVDLLRMNFRVVQIEDLMLHRPLVPEKVCAESPPSSGQPSIRITREDRHSVLAAVGYNTNLLPHDAVELDLSTDSWSEIHTADFPASGGTSEWEDASVEQALQGLYGYAYVAPVFRGRFAESILCKAVAGKGRIVFSNALFPTTRFHLQANGFEIREMARADAFDGRSDFPFKGEIDLHRLREGMAGTSDIGAVYLELCVNAVGGHPVSVAHLAEVRSMAECRGIPVILDTTRAFENAAMIRNKESGYGSRSLVSIVREICGLSDACAASSTKDFQCDIGGFVGTNHAELFQKVTDLILATGDGLNHASRRQWCRQLSASPEAATGPLGRVQRVQHVWDELKGLGVPVIAPPGGHAVFVDAQAMFPHISRDRYPAQVLANELFLAGGVRGIPNFLAGQGNEGAHIFRLAIPVGSLGGEEVARIKAAFEDVLARRMAVFGLERSGSPPGDAGGYAAEYRPLFTS